jgi:RimJ/RimL family protein N-acetyltransferase
MSLAPLTLRGSIVSLEPLTVEHAPALAHVGLEPDLWRLQPRAIESLADMHDYVAQALAEQERGASLPFVVVRNADREVIGSTRYMDIALPHRRVEIGATWIAPAAQRTGANVEAKRLLLGHAFDALGMQKVVFKTEVLNVRSRTAILALGAVEEGIFRKQLISASGRARDMIYFSILDMEWPSVRARLEGRLARFAAR